MLTYSEAAIDALLRDGNRPEAPGCALAIVHRGKVLHKRGYGSAHLDYQTPLESASGGANVYVRFRR
jgi:CubicO group peptidase (beta-lactamase class C family)